mgnify:CR=1 FL=1
MEPQSPIINRAEADKKFKFALKSCLAALGLAIIFFIAQHLSQKSDSQILFAVGFFLYFLVSLYAVIGMLVIKLTVRCHEELEKLEKQKDTNI